MEVVHRFKVFKGMKFYQEDNGNIIITVHKDTFIQELLDTDPTRYITEMIAEKRMDGKTQHTHMPPRSSQPAKHSPHTPTSTPTLTPTSLTDQSIKDESW